MYFWREVSTNGNLSKMDDTGVLEHGSVVTLLYDLHHSAPSLPASDSDDDMPDAARYDLQRSRSHVWTVHRVWTTFHDTSFRSGRSPESDVGFLQCVRSPRMHQASLINSRLGHYQFRDYPPSCHRRPSRLYPSLVPPAIISLCAGAIDCRA